MRNFRTIAFTDFLNFWLNSFIGLIRSLIYFSSIIVLFEKSYFSRNFAEYIFLRFFNKVSSRADQCSSIIPYRLLNSWKYIPLFAQTTMRNSTYSKESRKSRHTFWCLNWPSAIFLHISLKHLPTLRILMIYGVMQSNTKSEKEIIIWCEQIRCRVSFS